MEEEKNFTEETAETTAEPTVAESETVSEETKPAARSNEENVTRKVLFSLCYIWGILFFLPLIVYKNDEEAKVHANQGLALLLLAIGGNLLFGLLTLIAPLHTLFSVIASVYSVALLVLGILGIVNVVTDANRKLPIISGFKLIK